MRRLREVPKLTRAKVLERATWTTDMHKIPKENKKIEEKETKTNEEEEEEKNIVKGSRMVYK